MHTKIKNVLLISVGIACAQSLYAARPNIVFIMADDMGYECIKSNGCDDYDTPRIDQLAAEGIRFEQCFGNPKCTPSRVKLMTGLYNPRNYTKFAELDRSQTTFAHQLKKAGYNTCIAGKWQLGKEVDSPQHFGFDQACLWQHTRPATSKKRDTRYKNPHLEINGKNADFTNGEYGPDICADFICDFIKTNKDQPFIAYYAMILPHYPFGPTPDSADWDTAGIQPKYKPGEKLTSTKKQHFKDMVEYADKLVGRVTDTVDQLGLRDNTIIFFVGDNGTATQITTNWKGREVVGGKNAVTDEGTRVPMVANWPGVIKPGVDETELVDFADFLPTFCDIAGAPLPDNYPGDGQSLLPYFQGKGTRQKDFVLVTFRQICIRNKDYGIEFSGKGKNKPSYKRYHNHYEADRFKMDSSTEKERAIFEQFKTAAARIKQK